MRILFWNTNKNNDVNKYIVSLIKDYDIDILVLAEYSADKAQLQSYFKESFLPFKEAYTTGCDRINIWSNYADIQEGQQHSYYSIQIIKQQYLLCGVHLFSDLHGDCEDERLETIREIMYDIQMQEEKLKNPKTIIIGDMNEMPYGKGCLGANGFHGLPALKALEKPMRTIKEKKYKKYYNPMWNLLGDFSYPPGTYYLNQAQLCTPMWYMLDQLIIGQELISEFKKESLKIITTCTEGELMDKNGHPNKKISDHFPIVCEFDDVSKGGKENG